jgi:hypothetical protein
MSLRPPAARPVSQGGAAGKGGCGDGQSGGPGERDACRAGRAGAGRSRVRLCDTRPTAFGTARVPKMGKRQRLHPPSWLPIWVAGVGQAEEAQCLSQCLPLGAAFRGIFVCVDD